MDANKLECFKAYDIRGRMPYELNLELVRQIGLAFAAEFSPSSVCIGYDARPSSHDIALVLESALQDGGANVTTLGLCGTEEVYYAAFSQGFDGGIMITASHNPPDWNGLKIVRQGAVPVSSDTGLIKLRDRILSGNLPIALKRGYGENASFRKEYVEYLLSLLGPLEDLQPLRILANAGNGCAWLVMKELIPHLPCQVHALYETPDGTFPNGVPNPLLPDSRAATQRAVMTTGSDFGLAWDGDFDRCFFFDENGRFIDGYYIVGLLAEAMLASSAAKQPKGTGVAEKIIHDPRLIWNTREVVAKAGGTPIESKGGHSFMKESMRAENALYGGEMSGHHFFRDFAFCDSGMLTWLFIYQLLSQKEQPLSQLVDDYMLRYPASGEINRSVQNPDAIIAKVEHHYGHRALSIGHLDGLSLEFADWRCNIRKSNTEPLLRLNVESREDDALMQAKTQELLDFMKD